MAWSANRTIRRFPLCYRHYNQAVSAAADYNLSWNRDEPQKTYYDVLISLKRHVPDVWRMSLRSRANYPYYTCDDKSFIFNPQL